MICLRRARNAISTFLTCTWKNFLSGGGGRKSGPKVLVRRDRPSGKLSIPPPQERRPMGSAQASPVLVRFGVFEADLRARSEEHTSELQSLRHLVCRLLL